MTPIDRVGPESLLLAESLLGCVSANRGRPTSYEQTQRRTSRELVFDAWRQIVAGYAVFMTTHTWTGIDEMGELTPPAGALALRRG